jgi:hypothetical protein|tara:strand:+ start:1173 stop:1637 length:465 start_codon:yes stop_codon:yes gene_type:complete
MIVNFTLEKINCIKKAPLQGKIEAKNSIKFLEILEEQVPEGMKKQGLVNFKFEYKIAYLPDIASIELVGIVQLLTTNENKEEILKKWAKESKIDPSVSNGVVNFILTKCGIKALSLSQELGLPAHISLPKIAIKQKESSQKAEKKEKEAKPKAS